MFGEPATQNFVGWIAPSTKRVLAALLIPVHFPQFFSFVPYGSGVHAPGLGSQGGERASNARAFPLLPAALASVPFGFVLVRARVRLLRNTAKKGKNPRKATPLPLVLVASTFSYSKHT